ncbi:MAG: 23S rRNA (pseudouridine(1915)-N(3))-methyltransferase RlmH [Chloroflexi bacterium]|nr:MAG: 23S rRNA (pseudouridine(1915)-N(3))-methyltransferase RlmH [Chloroflexota bacterium]PIE79523.1 MAG: 23S rRNA (pseudouridine(1915)-N(3))-methyltransferase RlmH [Chloroflexota bacterium]
MLHSDKVTRRFVTFNVMARKFGNIHLITVGKMKAKPWLQAQQDYEKRLRRYTTFQLKEVKDFVGRGMPDGVALQKERDLLLKGAVLANRLILLSPEGKQMTSPELAKWLRRTVERNGRLAFLIGGPLGFSADVMAASHEQIALSSLTFTHEMARIIFMEQLYRAFTIINDEKYHK